MLARVLLDLHEDLVVPELEDLGLAERDAELAADVPRECRMGVARVDGKTPEHGFLPRGPQGVPCEASIRPHSFSGLARGRLRR